MKEIKMKKVIIISCTIILISAISLAQQNDFPKLSGPYLGQKPPGMIPEIFAPGIISTEVCYECCRAVSPDGKEFLFVREIDGKDKIFRMTEGENGWTKPKLIKYTDKAFQYSPFISPDGGTLLFMAGKSKPKIGSTDPLPEVLILKRRDDEWKTVANLGSLIDAVQPFYITMSKNNTLYFSCKDRSGIYNKKFKNSKYVLAEKLPEEINYLENASHPFIAADESYLIFQSLNSEADNSLDLYISFRKNDGTWTKAINMGNNINTSNHEMCPSISNDGNYLFFGRLIQDKKTDIYWVDAKIIDELRTKKLKL